MFNQVKVALFVAGLSCVVAADASAELVFLTSGRHISVKSHWLEGSSISLVLRDGGEIVIDQSLVATIVPDEVPYPEPPVEEPAKVEELPSAPPPVPYADVIDSTAIRHGVDPQLVRAVIEVESAYQPRARSLKGAMGLMQLMPQTARQYALKNPYDPTANIEAGVRHLKALLTRFELSLALAAYNAGIAAVERYGGIPPYPETRDYVSRVLGLLRSRQPA